jgi:hypothetical protein
MLHDAKQNVSRWTVHLPLGFQREPFNHPRRATRAGLKALPSAALTGTRPHSYRLCSFRVIGYGWNVSGLLSPTESQAGPGDIML